jgi:hypothetical protein
MKTAYSSHINLFCTLTVYPSKILRVFFICTILFLGFVIVQVRAVQFES